MATIDEDEDADLSFLVSGSTLRAYTNPSPKGVAQSSIPLRESFAD